MDRYMDRPPVSFYWPPPEVDMEVTNTARLHSSEVGSVGVEGGDKICRSRSEVGVGSGSSRV